MAGKRTRRAVREDDLVAHDQEIADFLSAFGRQPAKPPAAAKPKAPTVKAPAAKKSQVRNLAEAIWLRQVHAEEREDRRRERAGLPPIPSSKTWRQICDG